MWRQNDLRLRGLDRIRQLDQPPLEARERIGVEDDRATLPRRRKRSQNERPHRLANSPARPEHKSVEPAISQERRQVSRAVTRRKHDRREVRRIDRQRLARRSDSHKPRPAAKRATGRQPRGAGAMQRA